MTDAYRESPSVCVLTIADQIRGSETFIRSHVERLPANVTLVTGLAPRVGERVTEDEPRWRRALDEIIEPGSRTRATRTYRRLFRRLRTDVVIAEFGPAGAHVMDACGSAAIPLIVHVRGYDATRRRLLRKHAELYPRLFDRAAAIVVSARSIGERVRDLGAPAEKVFLNPSGVDVRRFSGGRPGMAPPILVAVGRFVEKKAPHLTLLAFAKAFEEVPAARLRMIGEGVLVDACQDIAQALRIGDAVTFLGKQTHHEVRNELRGARALVQHSLVAPSGNEEGTPNAVLEAGAVGLPVVATRHGGIPDVVVDGVSGFLVDEHDVDGMAAAMASILSDPALAATMGAAARERIVSMYTIEQSLDRLMSIVHVTLGLDTPEDRLLAAAARCFPPDGGPSGGSGSGGTYATLEDRSGRGDP